MLLSELPNFAAVVDGAPRVAPATAALYRHAVGSLIRFLGEDCLVGELSPLVMSQYHEWLRDEAGLTVVAANTYRRTLRALVRRAGRPELATQLRDLRPPPRRAKATPDAVLTSLLGVANTRDKAILLLMRDSGARRGAIIALRRGNVRLWQEGEGWRLAGQAVSKGGVTVLLLGGHECAQAVQAWLAIAPPSDYLFCTANGGAMAAQTINSMFRTLAAAAGLPDGSRANPHGLRHRFAQRMLDKLDAKVVSQLMGHSEVSTTLDVYGQRDELELMRLYYGVNV